MAIGLSHGGTTIYSSPSPSKEVLVGTREGVVTIARDGSATDWQSHSPGNHRPAYQRHHQGARKRADFAGAFHGRCTSAPTKARRGKRVAQE